MIEYFWYFILIFHHIASDLNFGGIKLRNGIPEFIVLIVNTVAKYDKNR